ncbi:ABC-type transport system periplasmic substrate-binding protein (probable substrate zinc/manganese/metal ions) [Natrialba magadii ATCC 43099]|uniref:ABC-type transport system periplasmic substrate-binding protein (Probable substrate zinc/manganese/metal ions) n=1 Tax=Natrialba magadii (strain ATCC 43099 / DSM 3394 / CCM 3739 / CIP 104546 / IAM 13178 / JCM 8861 / NBRC 102185 / NCIMB 2190 / MS3) TaxID=547559 RepID=D3SQQ9_NATMM|nr:metal ABC transporter substrate-binding protein [Natrialba magadii]ADD04547.1 ABC-type transport system periplasmic substrate-binding protein (probable substrate zinc/manganese/metal ions) [Natrialba magadii ATCC 43099]
MVDDTTMSNQYALTRRSALASASGLLVGVAGCLSGDDNEVDSGDGEAEYTVSAGFLALWDFTRQIAGEHMNVVDLVPVGEHGHDFNPGPSVVADVEESDAFVYLRDFASWQDDTAAELESEDDVHVIEAAEGIEFFDSPAEDDDEHFWMDPVTCQEGVDNIADALSEIDPENADEYAENAASFNEELQDVHEEFEDIVDRAETSDLIVATHDSFQWWHDRYGLDIYSPIGTSPDNEATPQETEEIERIMEENDIGHVLYDVGEPDDLANYLADETDAEVLPISPVETQLPEYDEADWGYVDHYREVNFPTLEEALEASPN